MTDERFDRNERLFGREGQARISESKVTVAGLGGLGSHVVQQLAYLGVTGFTLIDPDRVEESNLNRLVGARPDDVGEAKVLVARRVIESINPVAKTNAIEAGLEEPASRNAASEATTLVGCVDRDLARLGLTDISSLSRIPYLDLATDTGNGRDQWFGGRIFITKDGDGCLSCLGLLDMDEIQRDSLQPEQRAAFDKIYGLAPGAFDEPGPSIVSINGVVASLAVTMFMQLVTRSGVPPRHLIYRGEKWQLRRSIDEPPADCFYCARWKEGQALREGAESGDARSDSSGD